MSKDSTRFDYDISHSSSCVYWANNLLLTALNDFHLDSFVERDKVQKVIDVLYEMADVINNQYLES